MGWTTTPTRPETVLHYSEDADITVFVPHVPATNPGALPLVWAIEPRYAPLYWFPRDCPRVAVWANDDAQRAELRARFGSSAARVQLARRGDEHWIRSTELCEYRFDARPFEPWPEAEGQWIATRSVRPAARRILPDLVGEQARVGVDLRFVDDLTAGREEVVGSGLPFSIVRWAATRQQLGSRPADRGP